MSRLHKCKKGYLLLKACLTYFRVLLGQDIVDANPDISFFVAFHVQSTGLIFSL